MADLGKGERQRAESATAVANGKMTFGDALEVFKSRVQANPAIKPRTKEYCAYRMAALLKSWPGLSAKPAAELVQFLVFGGFRIGEAKYVTWGGCDPQREEIIVKGDPETGTKNSESRRVPMIPDMRKLLET
jgi:integrase